MLLTMAKIRVLSQELSKVEFENHFLALVLVAFAVLSVVNQRLIINHWKNLHSDHIGFPYQISLFLA